MALRKLASPVLLLIMSLTCLASAFQPQKTVPIRHTPSLSRQVEKPVIPSLVVINNFRHTPSILQNQRNGNDNDSKQTGRYTKVEDGSPLGVAIVILGGSLVLFGGDKFDNIPVWAVFVVASTAAGVARLIRYLNDDK
ncbi:unnamed protein product [Cylindrotheca closterium]|uniref:Transmembrane protein n=1 Tax=Cylindrotheca closterium TaxID=2856 RepID=A0AAD2CZ97_9STRA|nr:unnamed protein product [Cylindrotheca closterium]